MEKQVQSEIHGSLKNVKRRSQCVATYRSGTAIQQPTSNPNNIQDSFIKEF